MANREFKNSGLRMLEARNGDMLIASKDGKWRFFLNKDVVEEAAHDERKAAMFMNQLYNFIKQYRNARNPKAKPQGAAQEETQRDKA